MIPQTPEIVSLPAGIRQQGTASLREVSIRLEAAFLAEMLKSAGLGKARGAFGGGAGEEQFSSILVARQAEEIARAGGVGLAEHFFRSMLENGDA